MSAEFEEVLDLWQREAPSNRFLQYGPGEVAAPFFLPVCVTDWGYELQRFYGPAAVDKAREETGGSGFENYLLRQELWTPLNPGEPLTLRDNLIALFLRGSLYPEDFARDSKRAVQFSQQQPRAAVVTATFERTDALVNELAELSLNILNVLHGDRLARHPRNVVSADLRHYLGGSGLPR